MKNKRFIRVSVCLMMLSLLLPCTNPLLQAYAAEGEGFSIGQYHSGSNWTGTLEEKDFLVIEIKNEKDLWELADACMVDSYSREKWVKLTCDITLTQPDFRIPSFAGVFDGNGYTIRNYQVSGKHNDSGFIRYLQATGRVMNLTVEGNVKSSGEGNAIGGIVGHNYGVIENCTFKGMVDGANDVGGIAAVNEESGRIVGCTNEATVLGLHRTGGIAGSSFGVIMECVNQGEVNTRTPGKTVDYLNITIEELEQMNSTENVEAAIDSGGIAGLSEGSVYDCENKAAVGYPHVGYNTGGIVGRMRAGYVTGCSNEGTIQGRKDVGGIVGQMEPFMQLEYLTEKFDLLDAETEKLLELLDEFRVETSKAGKDVSDLTFDIAAHLRTASAAMTNLSNSAMYLYEVYNYGLAGIGTEFQKIGDLLEDESAGEGSGENTGDNGGNNGDDAGENNQGDVSGGDSILDGIVSGGDFLPDIPSGPDGDNPGSSLEELGRYEEELRDFAKNTGDYLKYMTSASQSQTDPIRSNLNTLNQSTTAASEKLSALSLLLETENDILTGKGDEISKQAEVVYDLLAEIRDDLFESENVNVYDESDDMEETADILQGKLEKCKNAGAVSADTCVGGIVGQISVEFDTDPEKDLAVEGDTSLYANATVRAIICDCISEGEISVKRDYAGGIVGKASYGAVISCHGYADIDGSNGEYIGGIAGDISGTVRSCYAMGNVNGKNYVGGIAGRGNHILYSCAFAGLDENGENTGNIAGAIMEDGILHCNFYVENRAGGVNGIAYHGGAMPLSYGELKGIEGLPSVFESLTVSFVLDGEKIGEYTCGFGEDVPEDVWPKIPEKEGYYSYWPVDELTGVKSNKTVEAQYVRQNGSLSAGHEDGGQPKLLVEGVFEEDWELNYDETDGSFRIVDPKSGEVCYTGAVKVRYRVDDTDAKWLVTVETAEGEKQVAYTTMGSYLIFEMDAPGRFSVVEQENDTLSIGVIYTIIIILLVVAIVGATIIVWKRKNGRKK